MTAAIGQRRERKAEPQAVPLTARDVLLLRIAAGGATRADLQRDVAPILAPRVSGTEFRRIAELAISALIAAQFIGEMKSRLTASPKGLQVAEAALAPSRVAARTWGDIKASLVLRAIGSPENPALRKAVLRAEGLAALVLQRHFEKPTSRALSPADLRSELAILALERAFGNKIKTGLGKGAGLPAKAGRLLAGQLFKQPREIATDGKLVLQLACETAGTRDHSLEGLELAVLRNVIATADIAGSPTAERSARAPTPEAANDKAPLAESIPPVAPQASPPDFEEFCGAVIEAARPVSEGWPGNRKAFISLVWKAIRHARPDWGLSEIAFKSMLAEAHRSGHIELASADLKDGRDLKSLDDSKILYKNTVWHYVRVQN